MEILIPILLFAVGVALVVKGGDFFVDAASWIAEVSGIPKLIIGATVVSVATTLPEMLVSIMAAIRSVTEKNPSLVDMSIGNAIGSVTANIGLILAVALIFMPGVIKRKDYLLKSLLMLGAASVIVVCGLFGEVNVAFSVVLLVVFAVFLWENVTGAKKAMDSDVQTEKDSSLKEKKTVIINVVKFIVGAVGIVWGADLLVDNGSKLATLMGVDERIIGVTLVAVGTSLPELITTITAIAKKQSALSVGNVLGANIMDLTLIMPLSSIISGQSLPITRSSAWIDLPACLLVGSIAVIPALIRSKFSRVQGFILLTVYAGYVVLTCTIGL